MSCLIKLRYANPRCRKIVTIFRLSSFTNVWKPWRNYRKHEMAVLYSPLVKNISPLRDTSSAASISFSPQWKLYRLYALERIPRASLKPSCFSKVMTSPTSSLECQSIFTTIYPISKNISVTHTSVW